MKKTILAAVAVAAVGVAAFGVPPFTGQPTAGFAEGEAGFESGVRRLPNGVVEVSALTPMPGVSAEMVGWWFGSYLQTTEHYQRWFPQAHVWMDWENKTPDEYIGASHLVHEYIGDDLAMLRIQFVPAEEILGEVDLGEDDVAVCARVGLLEEPLNVGRMCHIIRNTEDGAEMRSRFWLGFVAERDGNEQVASLTGLVANTYLVRQLTLKNDAATALMQHCLDEMTILAGFLPGLFAQETAT
ncbi:DAPG hydrolase family protein [Pararhodobacter oceanensis]|uniref:DAPG hydrolase PhiG domain-containing protein n=1 Tax=Pararhodobacter oceanensis TaxID=2172121 RepID=A0A2T8HTH4_9RHOB|nr:hypothetical protein [Pararhodobacter oceanensis]PVH28698.1 hypothetical protein DDE20_10945 [Pararhodobacter oceanensis]